MKRTFKLTLQSVALFGFAICVIACGKVQSKGGDTQTAETNTVLETIAQRKSVRRYTPQKVSSDTIDILLRAAMAAPSAMDRRPWQFVVVDDRTILDTLGSFKYTSMMKFVPQAMVICGDTDISSWWFIDCSAATQNFLLAVQSMGLAAVWTGAYPHADRVDVIQQVLGLPENIVPIAVIPFGYGDGVEEPKDKYDASKIRHNKW